VHSVLAVGGLLVVIACDDSLQLSCACGVLETSATRKSKEMLLLWICGFATEMYMNLFLYYEGQSFTTLLTKYLIPVGLSMQIRYAHSVIKNTLHTLICEKEKL
jgi:hypothetical protein